MSETQDALARRADDYVHGLMSAEDAEAFRRECEASPEAAAALAGAAKRAEAVKAARPSNAPETVVRRVLARSDSEARAVRLRRVRQVLLGWIPSAAAVAALFLLVLHLQYSHLQASPQQMQVFGQSELAAGSPASLRVVMTDARTGRPLSGIPVTVAIGDGEKGTDKVPPQTLAEFVTDADGTASPRFTLPNWKPGNYTLRVVARTPDGTEELAGRVLLRKAARLMLSTDKPVYQPGQTIRMRSLALRKPDLRPLADQTAEFRVYDARGNLIFKHSAPTGKFGIAAADCPLIPDCLQGAYRIECRAGEAVGQATVEVMRYVLPKFQVTVATDRPLYASGDRVTGTVTARYFFGKPVADADVVLSVAGDRGGELTPDLALRTDADGAARFAFPLPQSTEERFVLSATVKDSAGQKQTGSAARVATTRPIRVEVLPEAGRLIPGVANRVYVFAAYADGRPCGGAMLTVSGGASHALTTDEAGTAMFVHNADHRRLQVTVRADDGRGLSSRVEVGLPVGPAEAPFLLRPDKAVYAGGEPLVLLAEGRGAEPVFVDVIRDGQTLLTATMPMVKGQGELRLDLPPDAAGTLQVAAYRLSGGRVIRQTRVVVVRPASALQVSAKLDAAEYRPGTTAKLSLALTDPAGRPVAGAISLAAVDEAVFSVLSQRPGLEASFFTLERELLAPVFDLYAGWSPDAPAPARDQALLSKTADVHSETRGSNAAEEDSDFRPARRAAPSAPARPEPVSSAPAVHTLSGETYGRKAERIARERSDGLAGVRSGWGKLAVVALLSVFAGLWFVLPRWVMVAVTLVLLFTACLVPALSRSRGWSAKDKGMPRSFGAYVEYSEPSAPPPTDSGLADPAPVGADAPPEEPAPGEAAPAPRVRRHFPETLLWRPEVVTDEAGRATVEVPLADSITTWRLSAGAVSADGRLGGTLGGIRVFQPFFADRNLPVSLTRGDEIAVPVTVYNWLDAPQAVTVTLADAPWFERLGEPAATATLGPRGAGSVSFRIRVRKAGRHALRITARSPALADALEREIEVVPDGRLVEHTVSGVLREPAEVAVTIPPDAVEGSIRATLRLHGSQFSQLVEGLDAIFRMPSGCFEQTSSTTYPNVLALQYLQKTGRSVPAVEAKARGYIHAGYQRLLTFEVPGGGFSLYGQAPADIKLTAYGLMEFRDMAGVHTVDPALIDRTRKWLLSRRNPNGGWGGGLSDPVLTAYVAAATWGGGGAGGEAEPTRWYLLRHPPASLPDAYALALFAQALAAMPDGDRDAGPYLDRLESMRKTSPDGRTVWWELGGNRATLFYGAGRAGGVEATALAVSAMVRAGRGGGAVNGAAAWLASQKDPAGTWHSTQATVLALRALLAVADKAGDPGERRVRITVDGTALPEVVVPAEQSEVMQLIDLSDRIAPGTHRIRIEDAAGTAPGWQLTYRCHVPFGAAGPAPAGEALSVSAAFDRTEAAVGGTVRVTVTAANPRPTPARMPIVETPVPPGFAVEPADLDAWVTGGLADRYEFARGKVIAYLSQIDRDRPAVLTYRLRAVTPGRVTAAAPVVYEYYDPDVRGQGRPTVLTIGVRSDE